MDNIQKCVILCEGRHDLYLVSELLSKNNSKFKKATQNKINNHKRNGQSTEILHFIRLRGFNYLIKEEKDRTKCVDCFFSLYKNKSNHSIIAIMDYDGGDTIKYIKQKAQKELKNNNFLSKISDNCYQAYDTNYYAFLYPKRLTDQIKESTNQDISHYRGEKKHKTIIKSFLKDGELLWIDELKDFLYQIN